MKETSPRTPRRAMPPSIFHRPRRRAELRSIGYICYRVSYVKRRTIYVFFSFREYLDHDCTEVKGTRRAKSFLVYEAKDCAHFQFLEGKFHISRRWKYFIYIAKWVRVKRLSLYLFQLESWFEMWFANLNNHLI